MVQDLSWPEQPQPEPEPQPQAEQPEQQQPEPDGYAPSGRARRTGPDLTGNAGIAVTGEPRVDAALAGLAALETLPVGQHPAHFERAHRELREVLGDLNAGPRPAAQRPGGP